AMPETPYPVIINEAIEVTKTFGGTDGHKFVNGILDKLAAQIRQRKRLRLRRYVQRDDRRRTLRRSV
uniref:transcription antitermination factor NusB n=1 Tax=Neisseria gonorrhoeae TaxID=485 RepID=UPI0028046DB3